MHETGRSSSGDGRIQALTEREMKLNQAADELVIYERRVDAGDSCAAIVRLVSGGYGLDVQVIDPRNEHAIELDDFPVFETQMRPVMLVPPDPDQIKTLVQCIVDWSNSGTFPEGPWLRLVEVWDGP